MGKRSYEESKNKNTTELIYKTEIDHRYKKQTYGYQRGKGGGRIT